MTKSIEDFSRAFYPFLHDEERKPQDLMTELGFSLMEKARASMAIKERFFDEHKDAILAASLDMAKAFHRGHKMLVCGVTLCGMWCIHFCKTDRWLKRNGVG